MIVFLSGFWMRTIVQKDFMKNQALKLTEITNQAVLVIHVKLDIYTKQIYKLEFGSL